ncbi:MAG: helix-turn-helix domain-containing protein [Oscillospiraceae bacterium]|nr:helix-turn-helix domain-containing protein [Oscillospiraceae bacterium]
MKLGEKIYNLRTAKNLSQGDLAEMLGVSRQSISKWENNSAMPDLEKIIKLSDIFEVSIDEMVKGDATFSEKQANTAGTAPKVEYVQVVQKQTLEGRKIAGIILFCMAFLLTFGILLLTGSLGGIIYAIPFLLCGIICFTVKKHTGLVCCWTTYIIIDIFLQLATGSSRGLALNTIHYLRAMGNISINLIVSWIWLGLTAALVVWTVVAMKKSQVANISKLKVKLTAGWLVYIALYAARKIVNILWFETVIVPFIQQNNMLYVFINTTVNECIFVLLILLIIGTARYVFNAKKSE